MNRKDFFKRLGSGIVLTAIAPSVLSDAYNFNPDSNYTLSAEPSIVPMYNNQYVFDVWEDGDNYRVRAVFEQPFQRGHILSILANKKDINNDIEASKIMYNAFDKNPTNEELLRDYFRKYIDNIISQNS